MRQTDFTTAGAVLEWPALAISRIRTDGATQTRAGLDAAVVGEYAAALRDGATFPAIVVLGRADGVLA